MMNGLDWGLVAGVGSALAAIAAGIWAVDSHFVTRREFDLARRSILESLKRIEDRLESKG